MKAVLEKTPKASWKAVTLCMNRLGYDLLELVSIGGRSQQKVFSLRDSDGNKVKQDSKHPDFIEMTKELRNSTKSHDY